MVRAQVVRLDAEDHMLVIVMHHIVTDAWSMGVLVGEMKRLYDLFRTGAESGLPGLMIQYADFAEWQRDQLQGARLEEHLSYWRQQLGDEVLVLALPTDRERPAAPTNRGASAGFNVRAELTASLNALSQKEGCTLFMTLLASWLVLLARYSGQSEVVVGADVANRNRAETEPLIGFFVNMLVMRGELGDDPNFREFLARMREVCLGAYAHQDLPFEKLVDEFQPERELGRSPLFQVAFVLQNAPVPAIELGALHIDLIPVDTGTTPYDLVLSITEEGGRLNGLMTYSTDLFDAETVRRMTGHLLRLLEGITAGPGRRCSTFGLLPEAEQQLLLLEWSGMGARGQSFICVHEVFEAQAAQIPAAIAAAYGPEHLTYGALNGRANQLAHHLLNLGVGADVLVGISMDRSPEMIIGLLGILKAGGAYLPLDADYPTERLAYMMEDARASVLITSEAQLDRLPVNSALIVCLDRDWSYIEQESACNPASPVSVDNLAYVIYTSGSTGTPKGICIVHRAITCLVCDVDYVQVQRDDVIAQASNVSFDAATFEIWGALLNGGRLVGFSRQVLLSPTLLSSQLAVQQVSVLFLTTALFNQIANYQSRAFAGIKHLLFGGEKVDVRSVRYVLDGDGPPGRLLHVYGPTECTTYASWAETAAVASDATTVPIGLPLTETELYALDRNQQPVPLGAAGELYVGGHRLARGYLGRPADTAERFVPHCHCEEAGVRLYRTGDMVRHRTNGHLCFLGRVDCQVKVRGFRLELGEIESVLGGHAEVLEVAVMCREGDSNEKRLVAYIVKAPGSTTPISEFHAYVRERLPEFMAPAAYVLLDEMPLSPNGKINRKALPPVDETRPDLADEFVPPRYPRERLLAEIWSLILKVERVGVYDNFFNLGGDSILAIQVIAKAQELGLSFNVQDLFQHPDISALAPHVTEERSFAGARSEVLSLLSPEDRRRLPPDVQDAYPLGMLQAGMIFHSEYKPDTATYHDIFSYKLRAPLDAPVMQVAVARVVGRHAVLRTSFNMSDYSEPLQLVHAQAEVPLEFSDLSSLDHSG
ncbi:MAG: non-ribosomal peptide synthetase, partial [Blastocatellia bacterium]